MLVYGTQGVSDPTISNLGSLKAAYDYRAFGEQVDLTRYTDKVTETFTGKELDDETDLSYFGARMLDPMLGVWIAVDPYREFYHSYAYGPANPINGYDSDGRIWKTVGVRKSNVNNFFVWIGNSIGIIAKNGGATNSATAQKVPGKSFVYTGVSSPNEYISGISRDLIQEWVPDEDRFMGDMLDWTEEFGKTRVIPQTWENLSSCNSLRGSRYVDSYGWYPSISNETYSDPLYGDVPDYNPNGNVYVNEDEIIIE